MELVDHSLRLQKLVRRMDEEIYGTHNHRRRSPRRRTNPVSDQINLLTTAFARGLSHRARILRYSISRFVFVLFTYC